MRAAGNYWDSSATVGSKAVTHTHSSACVGWVILCKHQQFALFSPPLQNPSRATMDCTKYWAEINNKSIIQAMGWMATSGAQTVCRLWCSVVRLKSHKWKWASLRIFMSYFLFKITTQHFLRHLSKPTLEQELRTLYCEHSEVSMWKWHQIS